MISSSLDSNDIAYVLLNSSQTKLTGGGGANFLGRVKIFIQQNTRNWFEFRSGTTKVIFFKTQRKMKINGFSKLVFLVEIFFSSVFSRDFGFQHFIGRGHSTSWFYIHDIVLNRYQYDTLSIHVSVACHVNMRYRPFPFRFNF